VSLTATYDGVLSRVRLAATGLGSALTGLVERSTDQVTWSTVRGGAALSVVAGAASVDDYEFAPNVPNYYRITTPKSISFVAVGAAVHADNTNLTPPLPAGWAAGDVLLCLTAIRNVVGSVDFLDGSGGGPWPGAPLLSFGHFKLWGKVAAAGESAPTVHVAGSAGDTTSAQISAFRNAQLSASALATQTNGAGQNIGYPALTITEQLQLLLVCGWKADDWASVATLGGFAEIGEPSSTLGNDQGIVWDYQLQFAAGSLGAGSFVVTGGSSAVSKGGAVALRPAMLVQSATITPNLDTIWIKNVARPFLNRAVEVVGWSDVTQPARGGVFDVIGRSDPVAVTDKRGSRRYDLTVRQPDPAMAEDFRLCLAAGDPVLVHVPPTCDVPGMYAAIGDVTIRRTSARGVMRFFTLPLIEVAAPNPEVIGAAITCQTILSSYATCTALLAGETDCADVLEGIGSPSDVIVP
jgi:hypothetical protein